MYSTHCEGLSETRLTYAVDGCPCPEQLYDYLFQYAESHKKKQLLSALPFAREKHKGQYRLGAGHLEYFYHPMTVCAHAIALGITSDDILAAAILHDVCEDCGVLPRELPVGSRVQKAVAVLTRDSKIGWTAQGKELYYTQIRTNRIALLVKLLDRCNNVSTMASGYSRDRMIAYGKDTRYWVYPLFPLAMEKWPRYELQLFMLRYHLDAVLDTLQDLTE